MATKISMLAFLLAGVALGATLLRGPPEPTAAPVPDARFAALEARVAEIDRALDAWAERLPEPAVHVAPAPGPADGPEPAPAPGATPGELEALVEAAVEKKTREVVAEEKAKEPEKPSMDAFASRLGLTNEQRRIAEREVIRAQGEIRSLLENPTADGRNFMDEFVDLYAQGLARPDREPAWGAWFLSLYSTKIPGTEETYAQRAEAIKETVREAFRRDWDEEQYAAFEEWRVDPTEIEEVEGSPYDEIGRRIEVRARQLGAERPEDE